jgi:hypothetical protein
MAQESRPYSLSILLVSCGFALLAKGESDWNGPTSARKLALAIGYGATIFLAMLNHYFAVLAILGQAGYALIRFRGPPLRWWLASAVVAAAAAITVWGAAFGSQLREIGNQTWLLEQSAHHAWETLLRLTDLPLRMLLCLPRHQTNGWQSLSGLTLMAASAILAHRYSGRLALLFALWFGVPALGLAALDWSTGKELLDHPRYSVVAVPGLAGLAALAIVALRAKVRWFLLSALVGIMLLRLQLPAPANPMARVAAARLLSLLGPDDLLIYDAVDWPRYWIPHLLVTISHYRPEGRLATLLLLESPDQAVREQLRGHDRIAILSPRIDRIPDSAPTSHELLQDPEFVNRTAWIFLLGKKPDE